MRPHHHGLRCPKWKSWNVFMFSQAHKQHVAPVGFWGGMGSVWMNMRCSRKAGPHVPILFSHWFFFRLSAPVARILIPSKKSKWCSWKYTLTKTWECQVVSVLDFVLYYIQEEWAVNEAQVNKFVDSPRQVVRILQDVFTSSPSDLFS